MTSVPAGEFVKLSDGSRGPSAVWVEHTCLAVYLHEYQLVPLARVGELLSDLYGCQASEGTLVTWVEFAAEQLTPTVAQIVNWVSAATLQHPMKPGCESLGNGVGCMSTALASSRIWLGMPNEADRPWMILASGPALVAAPCEIAGLAMITISVPIVSVERTSCAIACMSVNRRNSPGRARWLRRVLSLDPLMLMRMSYVRETKKLSAST